MVNETQTPQRRSGPHAPLPGVAAAVDTAITDSQAATLASRPLAEDDPRARAAKRAAELREHLGDADEGPDNFYIDPRIIPDGWSYEWKTLEVLGKPNPSYQVNMARKGWEAVPRSRHPELMPDNYPGETIVRDGMILMERPLEITQDAQKREYQEARQQVRAKEIQLGAAPDHQFERNNKGTPLASVKKSREAVIPIPDK
jgi:hypothetical protein